MLSTLKPSGLSDAPAALLVAASLLLGISGCKQKGPVDDATLTGNVQSKLAGDPSLSGLPIQTGVQSGVVTLNGTVSNDAQRELAARDASEVPGATTVVNNLSVLGQPVPPPTAAVTATPSFPVRQIPKRATAKVEEARQPAPVERVYNQNQTQGQPSQQSVPEPQRPSPPPPPAFREITIPAGTTIPVRVTQTLDSATTQQGDTFSGSVASDINIDGAVAIPQGAIVSGHVDAVQEAAHFKGNSLLTVSLTNVKRMPVSSEPYTVSGKGRGKNTAEKTGLGAAGGAVLGAIFGGGKGAAIGAAAGGGLGAGSNAVTRGEQVQIASESVVRFRTTTPLTVRVPTSGPQQTGNGDLQRHSNQ